MADKSVRDVVDLRPADDQDRELLLKVNRARRLYERLGFREVAETPTHFQMMFGRKSE